MPNETPQQRIARLRAEMQENKPAESDVSQETPEQRIARIRSEITPVEAPATSNPGILQKTASAIFNPFGRAIANTRSFAAGVEGFMKGGVEAGQAALDAQNKKGVTFPYVGNYKPIGQTGSTLEQAKDIAGVGLEAASFLPIGATPSIAKNVLKGAFGTALKQGAVSGATGGFLAGTGSELQNPESTAGSIAKEAAIGTVAGGALGGVVGAVPLIPRGTGEILAKTTGTDFGVLRTALNASMKGGKAGEAFKDAMRGNVSTENIVTNARNALQDVENARSAAYVDSLKSIGLDTKILPVAPELNTELTKQLKAFKVIENADGTLDFSRSDLRVSTEGQNDIQKIYSIVKDIGARDGDSTALNLDSLKKSFSDLYSTSGKARAFVSAMENKARTMLNEVPGYNEMASKYQTSSALIKEIKSSLSLGDRASIETAFNKLSKALRTDNTARMRLVSELDQASGGYLSQQIAGNQLSSMLPNGIAGRLEGGAGVLAVLSGFNLLHILGVAAITSPRLVGETLNALGIPVRVARGLMQRITEKGVGSNIITKEAPQLLLPAKAGKGMQDVIPVLPKGSAGRLDYIGRDNPAYSSVLPEKQIPTKVPTAPIEAAPVPVAIPEPEAYIPEAELPVINFGKKAKDTLPNIAFGAAAIPAIGVTQQKTDADLGTNELGNAFNSGALKYESGNKNYVNKVQQAAKGSYEIPDRKVTVVEKDLNLLGAVLYGEMSNTNNPDELRHIANTAINRMRYAQGNALAGQRTLEQVLKEKNQYQALTNGGNQPTREWLAGKAGGERKKVVEQILNEIRSGQLSDTTDGRLFYTHLGKGISLSKTWKENKEKLQKHTKLNK